MSEENKEHKKEKHHPSRMWINGTNGRPSISATFATIAFFTTTLLYIVSIFEKIGNVSIRHFDPTMCAAYLTPVLMLYFGRRREEAKATQNVPAQVVSTSPIVSAIQQTNLK